MRPCPQVHNKTKLKCIGQSKERSDNLGSILKFSFKPKIEQKHFSISGLDL